MSTLSTAKVLGRHLPSERRASRAKASRIADAIAPVGIRGLAAPSSKMQKKKARPLTKSMREILDKSADIYSDFCKSRC